MWDVIVAGAGPAGAVAAYTLTRAGRRTLLADKLDNRGHKIGETLPGAAARLLGAIGLPAPEPGGDHRRVTGIFSSWNSQALLASDSIRDPYGPSWRLDRQRFDAGLRHAAIRAGATHRRADAAGLRRQADGWEVRFCDGGIARATWIVDATGRRAALARRLGVNRLRDSPLIAFYGIGRTDRDLALDRTLIEATPNGWWYAARLPSGAPMAGFHTDAGKAACILARPDAWLTELTQTRHVARFASPARFGQPLRPRDARGGRLNHFGGNRWIACGDAAMCFDPISGQGLFGALQGGYAGASAVIQALDGENAKLDDYAVRMNEAWTIYRARWQAIYRSEHRWRDSGFWSCER